MFERLKEFCMYMLGFVKMCVFKGGIEILDRCVYEFWMICVMGVFELSLYFYLWMIFIYNFVFEDGFVDVEIGQLCMLFVVCCLFFCVELGGVYFVDNG